MLPRSCLNDIHSCIEPGFARRKSELVDNSMAHQVRGDIRDAQEITSSDTRFDHKNDAFAVSTDSWLKPRSSALGIAGIDGGLLTEVEPTERTCRLLHPAHGDFPTLRPYIPIVRAFPGDTFR